MMTTDQAIVRHAIQDAGMAPGECCQTSRRGNVIRFHGWTGCDPMRYGHRRSVQEGLVAFGVLLVGQEVADRGRGLHGVSWMHED